MLRWYPIALQINAVGIIPQRDCQTFTFSEATLDTLELIQRLGQTRRTYWSIIRKMANIGLNGKLANSFCQIFDALSAWFFIEPFYGGVFPFYEKNPDLFLPIQLTQRLIIQSLEHVSENNPKAGLFN